LKNYGFCTILVRSKLILQSNIKAMNFTLEQSGLSARRKTLYISKLYFSSTPVWGVLIIISLLLSSCHQNTNGQNQETQEKTTSIAKDSLHKPKVNIKVNKHYDDKGNVIGFDSTYTSFYSNVEGDTARMDSHMNTFDRYFNRDYSLFFKDSLRYLDFFHDDFFLKRYELNDHYFRDMMNRMDSIKNNFYRQEKQKNSNDL
jgi:hypothetical protein